MTAGLGNAERTVLEVATKMFHHQKKTSAAGSNKLWADTSLMAPGQASGSIKFLRNNPPSGIPALLLNFNLSHPCDERLWGASTSPSFRRFPPTTEGLFQQILEKKKRVSVQRRTNIASLLISTCLLTVYHCCHAPFSKSIFCRHRLESHLLCCMWRKELPFAPLLMHPSTPSSFYRGLHLNKTHRAAALNGIIKQLTPKACSPQTEGSSRINTMLFRGAVHDEVFSARVSSYKC